MCLDEQTWHYCLKEIRKKADDDIPIIYNYFQERYESDDFYVVNNFLEKYSLFSASC